MPGAMRFVTFAALSFAAGYLGRITFLDDLQISLIVPASGVAVLWLATGTARSWPWDLLGIAVTVGAALRLDGATGQQLALALILTTTTAVVWVTLMRRFAPELRGLGGLGGFSTLSDLAVFMAASIVTAAVTALLRGTGLFLLPSSDPAAIGLTFIRNLTWIFVVVSVAWLLLSHRGSEIRTWWERAPRRGLLVAECALVLAGSAVLARVVFAPEPTPYAFPLVLATVWAAFRVPTVVAAVIATALGSFAVLRTLEGVGPFSVGVGPLESAAIAQGFLITNVLAALAIAFSTDERKLTAERARSAEQVAESRARLFSTVIDNLAEGVTVITPDDDYTVRNRAARSLTGLGGLLRPDRSDPHQPMMVDELGTPIPSSEMPHARARTESRAVHETVRVRLPSGAVRHLAVSSIPIPAVADEVGPVVVNTLRDVTSEQEERDQLVAFAGVVAHDLKNPLTVIRGWSESIQDELAADGAPDVAGLQAMIGRVQSASDQMRTFIDDLLEITVARDRPLDLGTLDLSALVDEVAELQRTGDARARVSVQPGMCVTADRFLVRQLLDNLIGNAVKYVAPGVRPAVTVSAREVGDELQVSISDNGIGIPPAMRERVFDTFARAHGGDYAGTGLGLAICVRVVTRHGGRIWVDEQDGTGTRISFTLPVA